MGAGRPASTPRPLPGFGRGGWRGRRRSRGPPEPRVTRSSPGIGQTDKVGPGATCGEDPGMKRPLRILTWHVHGNYLLYLSRARVEFLLPVAPGRPGFGGRGDTFPFPDRVRDVPAEAVRDHEFDGILFQSRRNYLEDQYEILTEAQRFLPRIYLEHDPPQEHPTDTRHPVDDPDTFLVHVTPFNDLMWDSGR